MDELLDFPVSAADYKVSVRDFSAGSKSSKMYIRQVGLTKAILYFNSKEPFISKYAEPSVISYWAGYQAALASWIKELEDANTERANRR